MLAILTSHPIQYQAPLWRAMASETNLPLEVWFLTDHAVKPTHDREFGTSFAWDQDLTGGYPHRFLNVNADWRLDRFRGIKVQDSWSKLFREHGVTHLWVEGWRFYENWRAISAAHRCGVEVWLRGETNDLRQRSTVKDWVRRALLKRLFGKVRFFLAIGTANARFYRSLGIRDHQLLSAPYCVDNYFFASHAKRLRDQRSKIRARWNIPEDSFCVLFCGKFIDKKRPLDLAKAVQAHECNDLHLLFVGSGARGGDLRAETHVVFDAEASHPEPTSQTQVADAPRASFAGFLNQQAIIESYVAADCLALPSDAGETWGLVVNEAMATGLPCVVSDQCGSSEDLIRPLSKALVFSATNTGDLRRAIISCRENPPLKKEVLAEVDRHHLRHTLDAARSAFDFDQTT